MNRRNFILAGQSALLGLSIPRKSWARVAMPADGINLVPVKPGLAPNYWCTWGVQTDMASMKQPEATKLDAEAWTRVIEKYINEESLFGPEGWAKTFFPKIRGDLYLMLDGGWSTSYSSLVPDPKKFPSFSGDPGEAMRRINWAVKRDGWRGTGLWCRDTPGGASDVQTMKNLQYGGIGYVKIDVGDMSFDLVSLRNKFGAKVTLEHVSGVDGGLNGNPSQIGRYPSLKPDSIQARVLKHTDVYRIYDLQPPVDLPTAIDRVTQSIKVVEGQSSARALINAESEVYLAAVLGCTMGIMDHPSLDPKRPSQVDQVVRAVRWQRIAMPIPSGSGFLRLDNEALTDNWTYSASVTADAAMMGKTVNQGAPARVSRNMELATVKASGEKPFVLATRFPNGAVAVGALPRVLVGRPRFVPSVEVTIDINGATGLIGVFGLFETLTITGRKFPLTGRVLAQDLAGDTATDITSEVRMTASELEIPGAVIAKVGLSVCSPGDRSLPGLVLKVMG